MRSIQHHAGLVVVAMTMLAAYGCGSEPVEKSQSDDTAVTPAGAKADENAGSEAPSTSTSMGGTAATQPVAGTSGASSSAAGSAAGSGATTRPAAGVAAGSGGSVAAGAATFSAIYTDILTKGATGNCMFAACHGGPADPAVNGGLQIKAGDKAGAYKNLVDAKSPGAVCSGKTYVIPGDSAGSLLIQKLADAPPCGAKMPIGSPLTAAHVAQIARWIDEGAQDN